MNKFATSCKLWCKRSNALIEFEVAVGVPYEEGGCWHCGWSMGDLFPRPVSPAVSDNSLHSLICALRAIAGFLEKREEQGDRFYYGECTEHNFMRRVGDIFWPTSFPTTGSES